MTCASARAQPADAPVPDDAHWYVIVADSGARLGHATLAFVPREYGRDIVQTQEVVLTEQRADTTRLSGRGVHAEDSAGRTLSLNASSQNGDFWSRTSARIEGDVAHIVRETPNGAVTQSVALPPDVRFDDGEGMLPQWDPQATPRVEFFNFSLDAMGVERVVMEAAPGAAPGARFEAIRTRYAGAELRGVARLVIDAEGRLIEVAQPMFGETIRTRLTTREDASTPHPPYHVLRNQMTRSPFLISREARHGRIRYRLTFEDGMEFDLPQTGEQSAAREPGAALLDICADCGPGLPEDPETLADALRPTTWMQSDHPRLRALADPVARLDVTDTRKMELLINRARPYVARIDFRGHYSALDTLERRRGDCTEAAVLLAALGRAAGIPTRVANGLAYSRERYNGVSNAFMPHSWTLAYVDGEWKSFDLALSEFDSSHIALTIGDGDTRSVAAAGQLASLLRFDAMTEVRTRD